MAFKFKKPRNPVKINVPSMPRRFPDEAEEPLTGSVNGMTASAPEERMARALNKKNINYYFRYTVGAPRGLPGWKELDFLIMHNGLIYAYEVDTAFTHRTKALADVLHDAIILNDREIKTLGELYPKVFHADGDSDLASSANAEQYIRRQFGV